MSLRSVREVPRSEPDSCKRLPKAALNEHMNLSPGLPSQLKSNVISLDCHISQYATVCQQLQAEVRGLPGELHGEAGRGGRARAGPWGSEGLVALMAGGCPEGEAPSI